MLDREKNRHRSTHSYRKGTRPGNTATGKSACFRPGANDKGGTSNDGNQARRFFHQDCADAILGCVPQKYKETTRKLHQASPSVLLRVVSSTREVNCEELSKLTTETSLNIATELKWVVINFTLHRLRHHSLELIVLNGRWSIGTLSEEALERNNKLGVFHEKYHQWNN